MVTDHLYHLLVKNYMRRDTAAGSDDDRFGRAVFRLHDAIFTGYRDWCAHVNLPPRVKELELETLQKYGAVVVSEGQRWWRAKIRKCLLLGVGK